MICGNNNSNVCAGGDRRGGQVDSACPNRGGPSCAAMLRSAGPGAVVRVCVPCRILDEQVRDRAFPNVNKTKPKKTTNEERRRRRRKKEARAMGWRCVASLLFPASIFGKKTSVNTARSGQQQNDTAKKTVK